MPRGGPDDGRLASTASGTVSNPAIDTARGSGFALLDNLGRLVLYDNFSDGLGGWGWIPSGTKPQIKVRRDNLVRPSAGLSPFGPQPVMFTGDASNPSTLNRTIISPRSGKVGIEIGLRTDSPSPVSSGSWLEVSVDMSALLFGARYLPSSGVFQIYTTGPTWSTIATFSRGVNGYNWWRFKVVMDPSSGNYARVILPGSTLLNQGTAPASVNTTTDEIALTITCPPGAAVPSKEYLGYVSLTQDEP